MVLLIIVSTGTCWKTYSARQKRTFKGVLWFFLQNKIFHGLYIYTKYEMKWLSLAYLPAVGVAGDPGLLRSPVRSSGLCLLASTQGCIARHASGRLVGGAGLLLPWVFAINGCYGEGGGWAGLGGWGIYIIPTLLGLSPPPPKLYKIHKLSCENSLQIG